MDPGTGGEEKKKNIFLNRQTPILATTVMVPTYFIPSLKKWFEAEFSVEWKPARRGRWIMHTGFKMMTTKLTLYNKPNMYTLS